MQRKLARENVGGNVDQEGVEVAGLPSATQGVSCTARVCRTQPQRSHLVKVSDGRARRINLLSDKALLAAYAQGKDAVDEHHVNSAARELPTGHLGTAKKHQKPWRSVAWQITAASLTAAGLSGLLVWVSIKTPWVGTAAATAEEMQPAGSPTLHFDANLTIGPRKSN